ncbi:hypothetical protein XENTR_v10023460 [Xenopus tropicalis]|uniref:Uncharacterized protein LOC101730934 n=1 Tax=Xenopus tropicalis TaxID=8364 RepID=A0A8J1IVH5_XENTR|nr:uncharacterized protein LOC101730934 [Xenopus tropicalis]KAE8578319.1 hypothetical protein XENTR_v10023460 [Xenopus tropicalis]
MDVDKLREYIQSFCLNDCPLGNQGYTRILLQLFGFLGHGKSSLINSCKFALLGKGFKKHAEAAANDGGLTMERKSYQLTGNITMVDNRGCAMINPYEMAEIYAQLCNFVPLDERVEWNQNYEDMMFRLEDGDVEPNFADFVVPIFVYSVKKAISGREIDEIQPFLKNCRDLTGIFPIIVLTNKTSGDFAELRNIFEGMGAEEILAVENYTDEDHFKTRGRHTLFLELIHKALKDVSFCMKEQRDAKRDRAQRKKFLLKYVHERDL